MNLNVNVKVKTNPWAVRRALESSQPKSFSQAGRLGMRVARGFLASYKNPNVASKAGSPPHSHSSGKNKGFKKTVVYALRPDKKAVWIGPQAVAGGINEIAKTHEFGGSRKVVKGDPKLLDGVEIGDVAPVLVSHIDHGLDKVLRLDKKTDPKSKGRIFWINIRTKSQAEHASRLYYRYCVAYKGYVLGKYPARPYMQPTLHAIAPKLPYFWRNVIKN